MKDDEIPVCCVECFDDYAIKNFIEDNEEIGDCDFCDGLNVNICETDDVKDFITEGFLRKYEDAAEHIPFESREGGYQYPTKCADEILNEEEMIFSAKLGDPTDLLKHIVIDDTTPYVRIDPYGPSSEGYEDISMWEKFCEMVKYQRRYTHFYKFETEEDIKDVSDDPYYRINKLVDYWLSNFDNFIEKGTSVYRARIKKPTWEICHKELTAPPNKKSSNNRMSPKGISFFYGSNDAKTAISEVRPEINDIVVVCEFEVIEGLTVMDFTENFERPVSIFDENNYDFYYEEFIRPFFTYFSKEIAKPIKASDTDMEYLPTQVFCEFLRYYYLRKSPHIPVLGGAEISEKYISGIVFKSSLNKSGTNYTFFRGSTISTENPEKDKDAWLIYKGYKEYKVTSLDTVFEELINKKHVE